MKVKCIKEPSNKISSYTNKPHVLVVGNIYTVIETLFNMEGKGYRLEEDEVHTYIAYLFAPLSDIDETELAEQREQLQTV